MTLRVLLGCCSGKQIVKAYTQTNEQDYKSGGLKTKDLFELPLASFDDFSIMEDYYKDVLSMNVLLFYFKVNDMGTPYLYVNLY